MSKADKGIQTLDEHIAALVPEVDGQLRTELQQLLRMLRDIGYPEGVLDVMMRLGLRLMALLYTAVERTLPSDNLFNRVDEARKQRFLPNEMVSYLHLIRILANKQHNDVERVRLQIVDAENVLRCFLRVLEWFYCECEHGRRLPTIYAAAPAPSVTLTQTLDGRIAALAPEVDEKFRMELQDVLRTLRDANNPIGVLALLSRLSLRLTGQLYAYIGREPPSDNLFARIEDAVRHKFLPAEMASYLHTIRILGNQAIRATERVTPRIVDAENALSLLLRVLEWFYVEWEYGMRLPTIYSAARPSLR